MAFWSASGFMCVCKGVATLAGQITLILSPFLAKVGETASTKQFKADLEAE